VKKMLEADHSLEGILHTTHKLDPTTNLLQFLLNPDNLGAFGKAATVVYSGVT
jgi:hypothetical protein